MADSEKRLKDLIESAIANALAPESAAKALAMLFPKVERVKPSYVDEGSLDSNERAQLRRISIRENAAAYFGFDPPEVEWSKQELAELFGSDNPANSILRVLERIEVQAIDKRSTLRVLFLERLGDAIGLSFRLTQEWLVALSNYSPTFINYADREPGLFESDNEQRIRRVIARGLDPLSTFERYELILSALPRIDDVSILASVFRGIYGDLRTDGAKRKNLSVDDEIHVSEMRDALLQKVRSLVQTKKLWTQAAPENVIWFWWGATLENEVRDFLSSELRSPATTRNVIELTISYIRSSSGDYERVNKNAVSKIINLEELTGYATALANNTTVREDQELGQRYLEALARDDGF